MKNFATHLPRLLLGLIFTVFGAAGLFHLMPDQPLPEGIAGTYVQALGGTYLFTLVKLTEVVAGLMLLSNRLVPLGAVLLAPVVVNILAFHALVVKSGVGLPITIVALLGVLAWQHRDAYRPLFASKKSNAPSRSGSLVAA
jgi:uncharacterized membrane protein YphA (DoxX/SURF4 family)